MDFPRHSTLLKTDPTLPVQDRLRAHLAARGGQSGRGRGRYKPGAIVSVKDMPRAAVKSAQALWRGDVEPFGAFREQGSIEYDESTSPVSGVAAFLLNEMKPAHGYAVCPVCKKNNVHATADGKIAEHYFPITAGRPCKGSGGTAKNRHEKPIPSTMKTESTPISGVAAFLGEAAAPEATTTVTFTGTQKSVAKAIAGMAKKPTKKSAPPSAPVIDDEPVLAPEGSEGGEGEELEIELPPEGGEGGDDLPPFRRDESRAAKAADIVESLIQE